MDAASKSRQEFRVVLDGIDLEEGQHEKIAAAVQKAAFEALATSSVRLRNPVFVGHGSLKYRPEWRGIWILDGDLADRLAPQLEEIGFMR
jgi:hypothetical protein